MNEGSYANSKRRRFLLGCPEFESRESPSLVRSDLLSSPGDSLTSPDDYFSHLRAGVLSWERKWTRQNQQDFDETQQLSLSVSIHAFATAWIIGLNRTGEAKFSGRDGKIIPIPLIWPVSNINLIRVCHELGKPDLEYKGLSKS